MKYNELISIIISSLSLLLSVIVTIHNFSLNKENAYVYGVDLELDHGAMVPLFFDWKKCGEFY